MKIILSMNRSFYIWSVVYNWIFPFRKSRKDLVTHCAFGIPANGRGNRIASNRNLRELGRWESCKCNSEPLTLDDQSWVIASFFAHAPYFVFSPDRLGFCDCGRAVKAQESMEMEIADARGIGSTGDNDSLDNKCFALDRSKRIFSDVNWKLNNSETLTPNHNFIKCWLDMI